MVYIKKVFALLILMSFFSLNSSEAQEKKGISTSAKENNSSIINYDMPSTLNPGQEFVVTIDIYNTGIYTWSKDKNYRLALYDIGDDVWGVQSVDLPYNVLTSHKVSFLFKITAPMTNGNYYCRWAMSKDNEFFGEYNNSVITVVSSDVVEKKEKGSELNKASFVKQTLPTSMISKSEYKVSVTMQNNGLTIWTTDKYSLAVVDSQMQLVSMNPWKVGYVNVPQDVKPGASVTFKFRVSAPSEQGYHNLQFALMENTSPFGSPSPSVRILVSRE